MGRLNGQNAVHARAQVIVRHFDIAAVSRVLQRDHANARHRETAVSAILDVLEKMLNHRRWNEEAGVLQAGHALEGDPDDQILLHHRPAAVAGIDGGVGLHGEKRAIAAVDVILQLDARHHAPGVGDLLAAGRVTVGHYRGTDLGQIPEFERLKAVEKTLVLDFEQGEIAVVRDEFDMREIRPRVLVAMHQDLFAPAHDVRVGHDAPALDDESRTAAAANRLEPPRCVPDRLLAEGHDLNDRALRLGGETRVRKNPQQNEAEQILWHAAKMLSGRRMVKQLRNCPAKMRPLNLNGVWPQSNAGI